MLAQLLVAASAAIIFALGAIHLIYTFCSPKLHPRDPELEARLKAVSPVITRQTTMWRAWMGFNASHSFGAMLFGAVYGYLALLDGAYLFRSAFLCVLGLLLLFGYAILAKLYWFSVPLRAILLAAVCYIAGLIVALRG